jgi:N-alpha-acetyltransferase 50
MDSKMRSGIWLSDITEKNVRHVRLLNCVLFPIRYDQKFYTEILQAGEFAKLVYYGDSDENEDLLSPIGAVCCRREQAHVPPSVQDPPIFPNLTTSSLFPLVDGKISYHVYIMTLGVLAPYRRLGIGSVLLQHILDQCAKDKSIKKIYLHVQTSNMEALKFYEKVGFHIINIVPNYYRNIQPSDAYELCKQLCI